MAFETNFFFYKVVDAKDINYKVYKVLRLLGIRFGLIKHMPRIFPQSWIRNYMKNWCYENGGSRVCTPQILYFIQNAEICEEDNVIIKELSNCV